jgi:tetratricopeptide (TPR) repeat protein
MKRLIIVLVLLTILPGLAKAQSLDQWITWGDAAMKRQEYYGASRFYDNALAQEPGRLALQWKMAEACRLSNQYDKAAENYERVYKKDQGRTYPDALRWLAEMQMCQGLYDDAERSWNKLLQRERKKESFHAQRAKAALEGCALAKADPDTSGITVEHLPQPLNSFDSEFAPRIGTDSLIYFSSLRGELTKDEEVKDTADYRTRIFKSDGSQVPQTLDGSINAYGDNANITWSLDGNRIYFTRCDRDSCRIHWIDARTPSAEAIPLAGLGNSMSTQPQIVLWEDREMLLFVSDRSGGKGGTDIWQAQIIGDSAAYLMTVNGAVNTIGNERTPWFDPEKNTLHFSSDFHPGHGGYDIFRSSIKDDVFTAAINAGKPINGPANDLYPHIDPQAGFFWFASNRKGSLAAKGETCCSDIYRYPLTKPEASDTIVVPGDTAEITSVTIDQQLSAIEKKFPVVLYFHNDDPDPRTTRTRTDQTYEQTFQRYRSLLPEYIDHNDDPARTQEFFRDHVEGGRALLNELIDVLMQAMERGDKITLAVRGHASPLALNDYNQHLSSRRISSLRNHLRAVRNGILVPYLDGTAENGGELQINELPFGEERSEHGVSDDLQDVDRSVYSVEAMRERRIEIEAMQVMSRPNIPEKIEIKKKVGVLRQEKERRVIFKLKNESDVPLKLTEVKADCGCTTAALPKEAIAPGSSADIEVIFNGHAPLGPLSRSITIFTDGDPQRFRLTFEGEVVP